MPRKRKHKGSSKAGRPRKDGERYPSGKLKPPGPNETILAKRKAGDADAGEHPLDFALSRQWITERQHKDAMAYRAAFNAAHIGGPKLSLGTLTETPPTEQLRMNWSQMSDEQITEIFDKVFSAEGIIDKPKAEAQALTRWKLLNAALTPAEREQMFLVCVLGSWPFWMPKLAADHAMGAKDREKQAALMDGFGVIARALRPPRPPAATIMPVPVQPTRSGKTEVPINYQNQHGEPIAPVSKHGLPFEVGVMVRRRA